MKRLGIFVIYDPDNIVDRYVIYLAGELNKVLDKLVIVYNGNLADKEKQKLSVYTDFIYERENIGYDAGAYKDTLCGILGWDEVYRYDELVLCNDTFFGPFEQFENIFNKMNGRDVDFWGITQYFFNTSAPSHIQSYFLAIRSQLLHSSDFSSFWETMEYPRGYQEAIANFELRFTDNFWQKGYKYDSYVDLKTYNERYMYDYNLVAYKCYELISRMGCPVLKKKNLVYYIDSSYDIRLVMDYLKVNTTYDTSMIWENVLRLYNITDLNNMFHFHYILDDTFVVDACQKKESAIVVCLYGEDNINECVGYLRSIADVSDVYIVVYDDLIYQILINNERLEDCTIIKSSDGELYRPIFSDLSKWLSQYRYIALLDDGNRDKRKKSIYDDFARQNKWDNLLKNSGYVGKVFGLFNSTSELGLLAPIPYSELSPNNYSNVSWKKIYPYVKKCLDVMGIGVPISSDIEPYIYADNFWARREVLLPIWHHYGELAEVAIEDEDVTFEMVISCLLPYVAQSSGYTSAKLENNIHASMAHNNMVKRYNDSIMYMEQELVEFCYSNKKIYIYGAGKNGDKAFDILSRHGVDFEAFVVSDVVGKSSEKHGHPIISLEGSDYSQRDTGYILALGTRFRKDVITLLKDKGVTNFYMNGLLWS